jgi:hypothetical protein
MNSRANEPNAEPAGYDPASLEVPRLSSQLNYDSNNAVVENSSHSEQERKFYLLHFNKTLFISIVGLFVVAALTVGAIYLFGSNKTSGSNGVSQKTDDFGVSNLNVHSVSPSQSLQLNQASELEINGQLKVNSSVVLAPIAQPSNAATGELYYNQSTNEPYYYNGQQFVGLGQQQQTVTSVQNQNGSISYTGGSGITLDGTRIVNSGVTSLSGTDNQIQVSQSTGTIKLSLSQDISPSSSPSFAGLNSPYLIARSSDSGLTVGSVNQSLSLQGSATTISDSNNGFTTEVNFATPTGNNVITFPNDSGEVCTTADNCGSGGGSSILLQTTTPGMQQTGDFNISGTGIVGVLIGNDIQTTSAEISGTLAANTVNASGNVSAGSESVTNNVSAGTFSGNGANLTNVNAAELNSQPASYYLNASNINTGTLNDARLNPDVVIAGNNNTLTGNNTFSGSNDFSNSGNTFTGDGSGLDNLNASEVTSGTLADGRLSPDVTLAGNTFNGVNELVQLNSSGALPAISGANLTNVNAAELNSQPASYYLNASNINSGLLSVSYGGTGANSPSGARTNLQAAASGANSDITSLLGLTAITPGSSLTIGSTSQNLTLQGSTTLLSSTNGGFTASLGFTTPTANESIVLPNASGTVCLSSGNCGTGSGITGSGTAGTLPIFATSSTLGNSIVSQNVANTILTVTGQLSVSVSESVPTLNATSAIDLNGTSINVGGTLSDVAYLDQANTFTKATTISANSVNALLVQNSSGSSKILQADVNDSSVGIDGANTTAGYALNVTGSGNFSSALSVNGVAVCTVSTCTTGSPGSFIDNGLTAQTANFDVKSAASGDITAVIQGASGQSVDLLDVDNPSGSTVLFGVADDGSITTTGGLVVGGGATITGNINGQTISSAANFSGSLNVANTIKLGGTNINTAGTLSNVAYLNKANLFNATSNNALEVQNASGSATALNVDTTNSAIGVGGASTTAGYALNVTGSGNFSGSLTATSTISGSAYYVGANNINTAGTLSNIAYLSGQANTFSDTSANALQVQNASTHADTLNVDTTHGYVLVNSSSPITYMLSGSTVTSSSALQVHGSIDTDGQVYVQGQAVCTVASCGSSGLSTSFIQNNATSTAQTANFNIQSAAANDIGAVVQGSASQTSDLLDIESNFSATNVIQAAFGATGGLALRQTTNTTSALLLQNAAGQTTLNFDNTTDSLTVDQGNLNVLGIASPVSATLTLVATGGSLTKNTSYYYEVSSVNGSGTGIPTVPTPAFIKDTTNSLGSATLSWSSVIGALSYNVFREAGIGSTWFYISVPTSACSGGTCTINDNTASGYSWTTAGNPASLGGSSGSLLVSGNITGYELSAGTTVTAGTSINVTTSANAYQINGYNVLSQLNGSNDLTVGNVASGVSGTNLGTNSYYTVVGEGANAVGSGTSVGYKADSSGGGSATAIGASSKASAYSVSVGAGAGNLTGTSDTAVGYQSLQNDTGGYNVGIGTDALEYNSSGTGNTAIGNNSGLTSFGGNFASSTDNNNTFLGGYTGTGLQFQQIQNASAIGFDSVVNQNNTVALGCNAGNVNCMATTSVSVGSDGYAAGLFSVGDSIYNTGGISQSGTTITGYGTTFTSAMNGATINYDDGTSATVTYVSATSLTSSVSKSASSVTGTATESSGVVTGTGFTSSMVGEYIIFSGYAPQQIVTYTSATSISTNTLTTIASATSYTIAHGYTLIYSGFNVSNTGNGYVGIGTSAPGNLLSIGALTTASSGAQIAVSTGGTTNSGIVVQDVASQSSGYILQAQNSSGTVLASIDYQGNLTVKAATINGTLSVNGHIVTGNTSGTTSVAAAAGVGSTGSCSISPTNFAAGNDTSGTISITNSGSGVVAGTECTITFGSAYASYPHVVISPADNNAYARQVSAEATSTSTFIVVFGSAGAGTYTFNYFVAQ